MAGNVTCGEENLTPTIDCSVSTENINIISLICAKDDVELTVSAIMQGRI